MGRASVPSVDQLKPSGDPLTFLSPSPSASPSDLPATEATEGSELVDADPWSSEPAESVAVASEPRSAGRTSSKASSGSALGNETVTALTHAAVLAGGEMLHETLARDDAAVAVGMWLTDDADAENIGDPLARIINRHNPISDVVDDTDAGDAIAALAGLGVYAFRQFTKWRQARALRRSARPVAAADAPEEPQEHPAEPAAASAAPFGSYGPPLA